MRDDAIGLFWQDFEKVKEVKPPPPKRTPPNPVWLEDNYLPGLEAAKAFEIPLFTPETLNEALANGERLVLDTECFENYWLISFAGLDSGLYVYFEIREGVKLDRDLLNWILNSFTTVGFNSHNYDLPMIALALAGKTTSQLKQASDMLIKGGERPYNVLKSFKAKKLKIDHIDLVEVAPLTGSLKIYGGRLHSPKMQDLPFNPDKVLSPDQITIVRFYCCNDLINTAFVYMALLEQIKLRETMSVRYGIDLRSKSDAQVAEAVIASEVERLNFVPPTRPDILPGTLYKYQTPQFIKYETSLMNDVLEVVQKADFIVSEQGSIGMPAEVGSLNIKIADANYQMGIGGLHSQETRSSFVADPEWTIVDRDVVSYYPSIILNLGIYPKHLGVNFLSIYRDLVQRRLIAKKNGDKVVADSLKITINGSFGKLGSKWSVLYSPDLLIQVTLTGQLSLLMLIEKLELNGFQVLSANTDGIVIKSKRTEKKKLDSLFSEWEKATGFQTEETEYLALYSRDVNNYIAIKPDGKTKTKGAYSNPWEGKSDSIFRFHKNPVNTICIEAVVQFLSKGVPIEQTVKDCSDITKFLTVRAVRGGGVKNGVFLGKAVRWYYAKNEPGEIVYAKNGNRVPRSVGAKPLMELPDEIPNDIDFDWYINESVEILKEIAYLEDKPSEERLEEKEED